MLIKRAVLAAAMVAGAAAYANYDENSTPLHVVYCKAAITPGAGSGWTNISVTLPATEGYYDRYGNPITYWNVGEVSAGGVVDSWHQEGGPGRFTAKNVGNCGIYLYVRSCSENYHSESLPRNIFPWDDVNPDIFGDGMRQCYPCSSLQMWRHSVVGFYHLAFTTDVTAKVPTWHSLAYCLVCQCNHSYGWHKCDGGYDDVAAYMGYLEAGEYLPFDMKLWAPRGYNGAFNMLFTFCVEASPFPLWDHGRAVE